MTNYEARLGGIRRLLGTDAQKTLRRAHVCVIGIGGVGDLGFDGCGCEVGARADPVCAKFVNDGLRACGQRSIVVERDDADLFGREPESGKLPAQYSLEQLIAPR